MCLSTEGARVYDGDKVIHGDSVWENAADGTIRRCDDLGTRSGFFVDRILAISRRNAQKLSDMVQCVTDRESTTATRMFKGFRN